jgi:hypothetical protein
MKRDKIIFTKKPFFMEDVFMKRIMCWVIVAGFFTSSFATDARVLTMGRHDNFFMDDVSIFRNPANINYYPNMLMGSLGQYIPDSSDNTQFAGLRPRNKDPQKPFAGTILSYSLNQASEGGNQYPLLSIGAIFNRNDPLLNYLDPRSDLFANEFGKLYDTLHFKDPVGKMDIMVGYAFPNGGMIGVGGYFAFQNMKENEVTYASNLFKGNIGINWPLAKSMNLEASINIASMEGKGLSTYNGSDSARTLANKEYSWKGDIRLFSALTSFNGDFVPHFGIEQINLLNGKYSFTDVAGGLGININIDKGFFWAALEGLYESKELKIAGDSLKSSIGGRISAGLERNVIWDWWVWRIGVNKKIMYITDNVDRGRWDQNPEANGSDFDFLSFGWGLNIDNRFKVDAVIAEDVFFTWTNLVSGSMHHLTNRITATYSF